MLPKSSPVYEDNDLLVIDKPSGVTVNRAETTKGAETVEDWFESIALPRHGIVHRLDKDTSGLLLIAKTAPALLALQVQFKNRQVKKTYLTLVHGRLEPVGRNQLNRRRFGVFIDGRPAVSGYRVVTAYPDYSLVEVYPQTGRTHQIRVHFKHLNHPVVADPFYLGDKRLKQDLIWCPRLFLHSHKVSFRQPTTHRIINLTAPLSHDLRAALEKIPN